MLAVNIKFQSQRLENAISLGARILKQAVTAQLAA
jgi:hypothetical protein